MTSSTTSSSSLRSMAENGYTNLIHTLLNHVLYGYPKNRFLCACTITVNIACNVNGNWLSSPFVSKWESPNLPYFNISAKDPNTYDRKLFEQVKLNAKSKNEPLSIISQRIDSKAVGDYLDKLKLIINAEKTRDWREFLSKRADSLIQRWFKEIKDEARITQVTITYLYSPTSEPQKKIMSETTLTTETKCGACDTWQSTTNKLVHCTPCILAGHEAYYCNADCAKWDPNHKCTQVKPGVAS